MSTLKSLLTDAMSVCGCNDRRTQHAELIYGKSGTECVSDVIGEHYRQEVDKKSVGLTMTN